MFQATQYSQTIQFSISIDFLHTDIKTVLYLKIHFSVSTASMLKLFYFKQFSLA